MFPTPDSQVLKESLAPEVEEVLQRHISLVATVLSDPIIIQGVRKANEDHKNISPDEIRSLDSRWRDTKGVGDFIKAFLSNEVAIKLIEFQEEYPGFSEVFVTDEHGLNVGQTNKTTDYYQADEDWWIGAYKEGEGNAFYGPIEFDESAQAEAISLYVPVKDLETNKVIGVAKAVLSLSAIKLEL